MARPIAVLVDGDQLPPDGLTDLIARLEKKWLVSERIIVRNWRSTRDQKQWREFASDHAFRLYQRDPVAVGKNASDIELAITAMDLYHKDGFRAFCIVTGDTDFTPVIERLKRGGCHVEQVLPTEIAKAPTKRRGVLRRPRKPAAKADDKAPAKPAATKRTAKKRPAAKAATKAAEPARKSTPAKQPRGTASNGRRPAKAPKGLTEKQATDLRNAYARHVRRSIDQLMKAGNHSRGWVSVNRLGSALGEEGLRREDHGFAKTRPMRLVLEDLGFKVEQTETGGYQVKM